MPTNYERRIKDELEAAGIDVRLTKNSGARNHDGDLTIFEHRKILVECKENNTKENVVIPRSVIMKAARQAGLKDWIVVYGNSHKEDYVLMDFDTFKNMVYQGG